MQKKSTLEATLVGLIVTFSLNAYAADADKALNVATPETQPQKLMTKKQVKPHSHLEEKLGISPAQPEKTSNPAVAANDKSKHYHPRDGK